MRVPPTKKWNPNYLAQISNNLILQLYNFENCPELAKFENCEKGFKIAKQYQIKEIFWTEGSQSITSEIVKKISSYITPTNPKSKYKVSSGMNTYIRDKIGEIIRKKVNEIDYGKFMKAWRNGDYPEVVMFLEKFELHVFEDHIWAYFNTFIIEKKQTSVGRQKEYC
jgi:hypothetical protein